MTNEITMGTILIREDTLLASHVTIETQALLPGWRIVRNLDGRGLAREIAQAHWNFLYLAGETKGIAIGRVGYRTLRRAIKGVLANLEGRQFNCLQIRQAFSRRFLGIPFVRVSANWRHIQEGIGLTSTKDLALRTRAVTNAEGITAPLAPMTSSS
jgi:hypothetical protein